MSDFITISAGMARLRVGSAVALVAAALLALTGCNDPFQSDNDNDEPVYRITRTVPTETVTLAELLQAEDSNPELWLRLNRDGFEVREYAVRYVGLDSYDLMVELEDPNDVAIGHGDSGSPIVDGAGRVVAALYAGDATNKELFYARPIEDMTHDLAGASLQSAQSQPAGRRMLTAHHVIGLNGDTVAEFRSAIGLPPVGMVADPRRADTVAAHAAQPTTTHEPIGGRAEPVMTPVPGQSMLVRFLEGNIFRAYVTGTVTFVVGDYGAGGAALALGHDILGPGTSSVPVERVPAVGFVKSYVYPYKVINPFVANAQVGYLTKENYTGVQVVSRPTPPIPRTTVSSMTTAPGIDIPDGLHYVAPSSRLQQDLYYQTLAILSGFIFHYERSYAEQGTITITFTSLQTTTAGELADGDGGITDVTAGPLEITYEDYLAEATDSSYLSYLVSTVNDTLHETYRTQPPGTRFETITTTVDLTRTP